MESILPLYPPVTLVWEMVVNGVGGSWGIEDKIGD